MTPKPEVKEYVGINRLFAVLIDAICVYVICLVIALPFTNSFDSQSSAALTTLLVLSIYEIVLPVYILKGQTIGKKILGLKVVNYDGSIPNLKQYLIRGIVKSLTLIILAPVAYLGVYFTKRGEGLHGLASKTLVVKTN